MAYAVLFKIYFVDAFVIRQLERLKTRIGNGHLYVLIDETKGDVGPVPHDRILRMTEEDLTARGFVNGVPKYAMFWHCADYSLYRLYEEQPDYDYYVTVEYDAVINAQLDDLVAAAAARNADFIGEPIATPIDRWAWTRACNTIYAPKDLKPYLNAIAFFSRRAIPLLRQRRLALSARFRNGEIVQYPLSEAFIATELYMAGYITGRLSDLGDTSNFNWWPPTAEIELLGAADKTFIHPVLDQERYLASLVRPDQLGGLFAPNSPARTKLAAMAPRDYLPKLLPNLANMRRPSGKPLLTIAELNAPLFEGHEPSPNIALGKPATQSSLSPYSRRKTLAEDAAGAVNGLVTGTFGFHTGLDDVPWWMVDLEASYNLDEIWIFNRLHFPRRARNLRVLISGNGVEWTRIFDRSSDQGFLGGYGKPLVVAAADKPAARFIRIELKEKQHLHLDQVKVFGTLAAASPLQVA